MPESDGERCYRIKHPTEPRADRYTERVEVLLLASDGKPKHPARPADDARHMRTLGRRYPNRGTGMKSHGMV